MWADSDESGWSLIYSSQSCISEVDHSAPVLHVGLNKIVHLINRTADTKTKKKYIINCITWQTDIIMGPTLFMTDLDF